MEGVQLKRKVRMVQRGWGPQTWTPPCASAPAPSCLVPGPSAVPIAGSGEDPIFNIDHQNPGFKQMTFEIAPAQEKCSDANIGAYVAVPSEDISSMVVDMGAKMAPMSMENLGHFPSGVEALEQGDHIKWRRPILVYQENPIETKREGIVKTGDFKDVYQMYKEQSPWMEQGVICNPEVLHSVNGDYQENEQYIVNPARFKGGYGVCSMCQDTTTGITVMRKTVTLEEGKWKNEVLVPLQFPDTPGIPEVYGVIQMGQTIQIFQKFAGDSLEKLRRPDSGYAERVSDPNMVLGLAFQGFKTLQRLHSKGVQHLDIKPGNLCVDMGGKPPSLHLIDYGSCQMPGEVTNQGFTYEYMSPESARTYIQNQQVGEAKQQPLGDGTDVWGLTLSLMYCLRGFHVMVHALTGDFFYQGTQEQQGMKRIASLLRILNLTDADMGRLINPAWPAVLKELFTNTLRVDKDHRWSAKQAAEFIFTHIMQSQTSGSVGRPGPPSGPVAHRPSPSASSSGAGRVASPVGFQGRLAAANGSAAVASAVRLRGSVTQIVPGGNQLSPWNVAFSPGNQLRQSGFSAAPCVLKGGLLIQPGKRKLEDDEEEPMQCCKIIKQ